MFSNARLSERRLPADARLPFDFTAGYVGYLGYEMKADCGADAAHRARTPDAMWIFADRMIAVDHETGLTYLLACHDGSDGLRRRGPRVGATRSPAGWRRWRHPPVSPSGPRLATRPRSARTPAAARPSGPRGPAGARSAELRG